MNRHLSSFTPLGVLKQLGHRDFPYFEYKYLCYIRETLVYKWPLVQGGVDTAAWQKWAEILQVLELDVKSMWDLFLLAHQGRAGRSEANEILWDVLSGPALDPDYRDLSHKVTNLVGRARRHIDRPPARHEDRAYWTWSHYWVPRNPAFSPDAVPREPFSIYTTPRGRPIAPPHCWQPYGRNLGA